MPYVEATTLESLRMFMGRGFGVPHRATKNTTLGGYFIPKVKLRLYAVTVVSSSFLGYYCNSKLLRSFDGARFS